MGAGETAPITRVVGTHRDWTDVAHIGHGSGRIDLEGDELVRALLPEDGELRLALVGGKDSGHFEFLSLLLGAANSAVRG
jgi:hypothetical protein